MIKKIKKAVKKAVKKAKVSVAEAKRRKLELSYVNEMIKTLEAASGNGTGATMVKDKKGKVEMVKFANKEEAIAVLKRIKKGDLSLVM